MIANLLGLIMALQSQTIQLYFFLANILLLFVKPVASAEIRSGNFLRDESENVALQNVLIKEVTVTSAGACAQACLANTFCLSFNVGPRGADNGRVCHLNLDTSEGSGTPLTTKSGFRYYEKVIKFNICFL